MDCLPPSFPARREERAEARGLKPPIPVSDHVTDMADGDELFKAHVARLSVQNKGLGADYSPTETIPLMPKSYPSIIYASFIP